MDRMDRPEPRLSRAMAALEARVARLEAVAGAREVEASGEAPGQGSVWSVLEALSASVALLDPEGVIVGTNGVWRRSGAERGLAHVQGWNGVSYLAVCDRAAEEGDEEAGAAARGIRDVLSGRRADFRMEYPCATDRKRLWFRMRVTWFDPPGPVRAVVCHDELTDLQEARQRLEAQSSVLETHAQELDEAHAALKVLLGQQEEIRREVEENVLASLRQSVLPYLDRVASTVRDPVHGELLGLARARLEEAARPFYRRLTQRFGDLTPREIEVAGLVREGKSSKDIARILNLSVRGVEFHRDRLRKKLGLRSRKENLRSVLLGLG